MTQNFLSRSEASHYLSQRWGRVCAIAQSTLAKYAVVGGGPPFRKYGHRAIYDKESLDKWAQNRLSNLKMNTACPSNNEGENE